MHPLNGALSRPYVPVRVTRDAVVAHRYSYVPPRSRTSQYRRIFVPLSYPSGTDLADLAVHFSIILVHFFVN